MKLKFKILIFSLSLITSACNDKSSNSFDLKLIEIIIKEKPEYPILISSTLFGKCNETGVVGFPTKELRFIYKAKYKNLEYAEFVKLALNQKLDLNYSGGVTCFSLDLEVKNFYNNNQFEIFLDKFCKKVNNTEYRLKYDINEKQINSILYFLFVNNYLNFYDDMSGIRYIRNLKYLNYSLL